MKTYLKIQEEMERNFLIEKFNHFVDKLLSDKKIALDCYQVIWVTETSSLLTVCQVQFDRLQGAQYHE